MTLRRLISSFSAAYLAPLVLAAAAWALVWNGDGLPGMISSAFALIPVLAALLGMVLGWWFNRSRASFALVILGVGHLLSTNGAPPLALTAFSVLLPLNFAVLALLPERGMLNGRGIARALLLFLQAFVLAAILGDVELAGQLDQLLSIPVVPAGYRLSIALPDIAWMGGILALIICAARRHPLDAALGVSAVTVLGALHLGGAALAVGFGAAGLMILFALMQEAYRMAFVDDLTGLPARRALTHALEQTGSRYTVAMLDVDHFKKFNDTYGHDVGDEVLRRVAQAMSTVGGGGKPYRFGGEEFTVLFPGKSSDKAVPHLEKLRERIAAVRFTPEGKKEPVSVTISIGAATNQDDQGPWQVVKSADQLLYKAKEAGRNRVEAA